jgi:hypothetical protein
MAQVFFAFCSSRLFHLGGTLTIDDKQYCGHFLRLSEISGQFLYKKHQAHQACELSELAALSVL